MDPQAIQPLSGEILIHRKILTPMIGKLTTQDNKKLHKVNMVMVLTV